ncbi:N(2),N(2)-dimethylguanosine tRNA methyltransferase [Archaeoglobus sulfaticallidus PM70-1]|uniref:tRNA (guanine(26)-N(2))-dimethyltransferase n=2 Tax=Archaeoglobus TaxID=2233 RepID=N0BLZ3_9EURY|nr:N(2),N(2)-dimethylguanosine tRNA methyltransferase [Archaeoglobus sulfaticallidus PM70-1]
MISEGKAKATVNGVFYNPRMKFCRDFDIAVFRAIHEKERMVRYLDALSASGIRGIRACLEAGYDVSFNDIDERAVETIKRNLELNGIEAEVYNKDANILMREKRFFHIDIDPFGSPAEFIDSACIYPKYLSVTATDTSALCGSSTASGLRKYGVFAVKTEYYPEVGLRALIGRIFNESAKYDKAVRVLVAFAKEHFYRVHIEFRRSPNAVKRTFSKYGYLFHCPKCLRRYHVRIGEGMDKCECGEKMIMIGPLWLGELHDQNFVEKLESDEKEVSRYINLIRGEIQTPFFYDLHHITKKLNTSPPKLDSVIEALRELGYSASRTRFSGTSFKTDADISEIGRVIMDLKSQPS